MKIITNRNITVDECPWLGEDIPAETELFIFRGCTYGCISPAGIAACEVEGENPFFEIPRDSYTLVES